MKTSIIVLAIAFGVIYSAVASPAPTCNSNDASGVVQYFADSDCTKFWQCSNGAAYLMTCANDGTNWNPEKNVCDWAASAGCTGEGWEESGESDSSSDESNSSSDESSDSSSEEGDEPEEPSAEAAVEPEEPKV